MLEKAKLPWRGFHAGRRGLGTVLRELTGNSTAARDVLGHEDEGVTKDHDEGKLPEAALKGMRLLEAKTGLAEKGLRSTALDEHPRFGGGPGEPVPEVDPEDLKTVWQLTNDVEARNPGKNYAIGLELLRRACRPGTNVEAVVYRAGLLWMMSYIAPENVRFKRECRSDDGVFRAAAKVPAEWWGEGLRQTAPFDVHDLS